MKRRKKSSHTWVREERIFQKRIKTFLLKRRETWDIAQLRIFHFRLSERLNVTIWMLDEESPDNNHTRFRQISAISAIFIGRTLKLFRKKLRTSAISIAILFPVFRANRSAWTNSFFQPRSQSVCFDQQNQNLFNFLQQTLWMTVKRTELARAKLFK